MLWRPRKSDATPINGDRGYWLGILQRLADPVLEALANRQLKTRMPFAGRDRNRRDYMPLEALGRLLAGIAPWLERGPREGTEGLLRQRILLLARDALDAATDPASPDFMLYRNSGQPVVDSAFLSHALLRATHELWDNLTRPVRTNVTNALGKCRSRNPYDTNWQFFPAMIEAARFKLGLPWEREPIARALEKADAWYVGDGACGDGPEFHYDYYNSFVMFPMMLDIVETVCHLEPQWQQLRERIITRARRFAAVQERYIGPDGSFPPLGRSITYRAGAFQLLSQMSLRRQLPADLPPGQARCALTAAIRRTMDVNDTFDSAGFLRIGLCGYQPNLGETYITTGSLYLCSTVLLPLGLPNNDPFWSSRQTDWSSKKAWSSQDMPADKALDLRPNANPAEPETPAP